MIQTGANISLLHYDIMAWLGLHDNTFAGDEFWDPFIKRIPKLEIDRNYLISSTKNVNPELIF